MRYTDSPGVDEPPQQVLPGQTALLSTSQCLLSLLGACVSPTVWACLVGSSQGCYPVLGTLPATQKVPLQKLWKATCIPVPLCGSVSRIGLCRVSARKYPSRWATSANHTHQRHKGLSYSIWSLRWEGQELKVIYSSIVNLKPTWFTWYLTPKTHKQTKKHQQGLCWWFSCTSAHNTSVKMNIQH